MGDLSSNTIELVADISDQVKSLDEKKKQWLSDKADILLSSENKKELVIGLIEDFNNVYGACKQIEKLAKEGVKRKTSTGLRSSLVEIVQFFDQDYQYKDQDN